MEKENTMEKNLVKVVNPEGEFDIPIGDGGRKKVFWSRIRFEDRIYFRGYFKKKLREAEKAGVIGVDGHYKGKPEGIVDGKNNVFTLKPSSFVEGTLRVYIGSTLKEEGKDYTYSPDLRVLFFTKPPEKDPTVEYDYYDSEVYEQLFNNTFVTVLIFLSAKETSNHRKNVFEKIEDVGQLNMLDISEIISLYQDKIRVTEDELKNSQPPLPSSDAEPTQNGGN